MHLNCTGVVETPPVHMDGAQTPPDHMGEAQTLLIFLRRGGQT